eukprot:g4793.t1
MVKGNVGGFVRVGWRNDDKSVLRIPRSVLTEEHVEKLFDVEKGKIDYLIDEFDEVIWPDDWATRCQNKPWRYHIVLKDEVEVDDVQEDPRYQGGVALVLEHVPGRVGEQDLRAWLRCGLDTEEKEYMTTMSQVEHSEAELAKNERRKLRVPQKVFKDVNGHAYPEHVDSMKRRQLAEELEARGENLQKQLERLVTHAAKLQRLKRRTEDVKLERMAVDQQRDTATWYAMLHSLRGLPLDEMVVRKKNWCDIQLCVAAGDANPRPWAHPVARLGRMGKAVPERLKPHETNMRGVHFSRQRHGRGCYIGVGMTVHDGMWHRDKKHGPGKRFSKYGDLDGEWEHDLLKGRCSATFVNGDSLEGPHDTPMQRAPSRIDPTRYNDGVPNGECEVAFADGSTYKGEMRHGLIEGEGVYAQPDGVVYRGQFKAGMKHGQGRLLTPKGEEWSGEWCEDEPHRECYHKDRLGGEFLGHWERGVPRGRVVQKQRNGDRYVGFVLDGDRTGRGKYVYGGVEEEWDRTTERLSLSYDHCYEGEWRAGSIRGRGMHTSMDRERGMERGTFFTTFGRSERRYPLLMGLQADIDKHARRWRRSRVRAAKELADSRHKLQRRARRNFRQQRVLAKKALREAAERLASLQEQMQLEIETLTKMKERRDRIRHAHASAKTKAAAGVDEEDQIGKELERLLRDRREMAGIDARTIFVEAKSKSEALSRASSQRVSKNMKASQDAQALAAAAAGAGATAHQIVT